MTVEKFRQFYSAVHGPDRAPFPWQERLVARLLDGGGWPAVIAVPTASGKTSVLDAAVFVLAAESCRPELPRTAALRIFFVVDRRLVVDDVTRHAERIARRIADAADLPTGGDSVLREVRDALLRFGTGLPLKVATLRGGMYMNNSWADEPNQPLICVSTVDQIGSRLLFRGYGVSAGRRPVDAALVACDSLIILDEAHLSGPFWETLGKIQAYRASEVLVAPDFRFVTMTATPRGLQVDALRLNDEDFATTLDLRLRSPKPTELQETSQLEKDASEAARRLAKMAPVVGIVLNTVNSARAVFEDLLNGQEENVVLLTGRIRPLDRDRLLEKYLPRVKAGRVYDSGDRLFVVATQTVEVGADLDFDALVSEAAPLDSLRQRFGRLNRIGRKIPSPALVLKPRRDRELEIYGDSVTHTWDWLVANATLTKNKRTIDFASRAIEELFDAEPEEQRSRMLPKQQNAPLLFRAHLDAFCQTNPAPSPDPDVAPFLHGMNALNDADVQLVWRRDVGEAEGQTGKRDQGDSENAWVDAVAFAPPSSMEALPLPLPQFRRWIGNQSSDVTDLEGVGSDGPPRAARSERAFLIWRGPDHSKLTADPRHARPGDTIVLPVAFGGTDTYGWNPSATPVRDIADECSGMRADAGLGRRVFRRSVNEVVTEAGGKRDDYDEEDLIAVFRGLLPERLSEVNAQIDTYGQAADELGTFGWLIGWAKPRVSSELKQKSTAPVEESGEDENSSFTRRVTLDSHTRHVVERATRYSHHCGLPDREAQAIRLAAELHDIGKSDERFQILLGAAAGELYAKGRARASRRAPLQSRQDADYPRGARHEFGSLALAELGADFPDDGVRDLVLHLVATHHGYGRAVAPTWSDTSAVVLRRPGSEIAVEAVRATVFARLGSGYVDRFWRLTERYGYWGLAFLETFLRRADCMASRAEEEE